MQGFARSLDMSYVQLSFNELTAFQTIRNIGTKPLLQLTDLGDPDLALEGYHNFPHFSEDDHKLFVKKIRSRLYSCESFLQRIHLLEQEMLRFGISLPKELLEDASSPEMKDGSSPDPLLAVEDYLSSVEESLGNSPNVLEQLTNDIDATIEDIYLLRLLKSTTSAGTDHSRRSSFSVSREDVELLKPNPPITRKGMQVIDLEQPIVNFSYPCGVIHRAQKPLFERSLFRISRGNAFAVFSHIDENNYSSPDQLVVCAVILGDHMRKRILNLISIISRRGHVRNFSTDVVANDLELDSLSIQLSELLHIRQRTETDISSVFLGISHSFEASLQKRRRIVMQEIEICKTLTKCVPLMTKVHSKGYTLIAHGWMPSGAFHDLNEAVRVASENTGIPGGLAEEIAPPLGFKHPTFFETNSFTGPFQQIVDTYGVPRYQEFNPAVFTIITFPFLFGVMYGDVGHGSILLLFSLYLILMPTSSIRHDLHSMLPARYMLLLMALFAVYCGLIYNDAFSLSISAFSSGWEYQGTGDSLHNSVYSFGVDSIWHGDKNELSFLNSLKMKMSIILGISHMMLGLFIHFCNLWHVGDWQGILLEFIPQLCFLLSTFGYMVLLILIKWCSADVQRMAQLSILQTFIEMFLGSSSDGPKEYFFEGQPAFETFLVTVAFLAVPVLFFGRPLAKMYKNGWRSYERVPNSLHDSSGFLELEILHSRSPESKDSERIDTPLDQVESESEDFTEMIVQQLIHTIEFVLGTVSNTASYLRLWALSLAHQQLSLIFWEMTGKVALESSNPAIMVGGFSLWLIVTIGVMCMMDVLECFLHALRLHWVEFQNKFFKGDGIPFTPFLMNQ